MHTNSGCRCLSKLGVKDPALRNEFVRAFQFVRENAADKERDRIIRYLQDDDSIEEAISPSEIERIENQNSIARLFSMVIERNCHRGDSYEG